MKKEKILEILILLVVIAIIVSSFLIFRHYKYEKPNTYSIVFKDIDSIVKGSPVRFMGINVGYVTKLKRKDKYIICKIRVTKKGVKLPDSTRAKVTFNGLGGSKSIELFPPETNEKDIKGVIADESLRLNDLSGMVKDLSDVAFIINNIVQEIDPDMISSAFLRFSSPEIINKIDSDMENMIKNQAEVDKGFKNITKKENVMIQILEWADEGIKSLKSSFK